MFSGLIGHRATVLENADAAGGRRLVLESAEAVREGVEPKDSISINGACLTVTSVHGSTIAFDVVPETIARTTLGALQPGDRVNVELSLRVGDRLGGHFVYGHVDASAEIIGREPEGQGERLLVATPTGLARFIVEKGYVALDGVSLTIASVGDSLFTIALIPETAARTTLGTRRPGELVNLEIDPIARYALAARPDDSLDRAPSAEELAWAYEI